MVIDKNQHLGENINFQNNLGIIVNEYAPHISHTNDKKTLDYVNSFVEFNPYRNSSIFNKCKKLVDQTNNVIFGNRWAEYKFYSKYQLIA